MKLLLDTQVLLWADAEPDKVSARARELLRDPANERLLSTASIWEMQIKSQLGKLRLRLPLAELLAEHERKNDLQIIPVLREHVFDLQQLPPHHNDPFDRLVIATARVEAATLLSADPLMSRYPVTVVW